MSYANSVIALALLSTFPQMAKLITKFFLVDENVRSLEYIIEWLLLQSTCYLHSIMSSWFPKLYVLMVLISIVAYVNGVICGCS